MRSRNRRVNDRNVLKIPLCCSQKSIPMSAVAAPVVANMPARAGEWLGRMEEPATAPNAIKITSASTCAVFPTITLDAPSTTGRPRLWSK
jgi:hypothetical protein